jgi:N-acetylhexosamine 1-kinase
MPGSILHDVGDALRSGTNTSTEDEVDLNLVNFNSKIYDAFMKSYLKKAKSFMTKDELENIHLSLPLLLFEQSCRFLGDYLNHDQYYVVKYDTQNLIRTKTQLRLLDQVCDYLKI